MPDMATDWPVFPVFRCACCICRLMEMFRVMWLEKQDIRLEPAMPVGTQSEHLATKHDRFDKRCAGDILYDVGLACSFQALPYSWNLVRIFLLSQPME